MAMLKKLKTLFSQAIYSHSSHAKLAQSFCMGLYIAFSPFPGAHTVMMFGATWLFRLNFPMLFFATSFNNPWTMFPFFASDYSFGYWLTHNLFGWNSHWIVSYEKLFGTTKVCLLSFLIGGNILGILAGIIAYPFVSQLFKTMRNKYETNNKKQKSIS